MESEHFLFSMQKIHVALLTQYLDQEFGGKWVSFWLFHVSSRCAWKAAPLALKEEPGRVCWKSFSSCGGSLMRPGSPSRLPLLQPEGSGAGLRLPGRVGGPGGYEVRKKVVTVVKWFSGLLLSPQRCRWVLLILGFSLLLGPVEGCACLRFLPWVRGLRDAVGVPGQSLPWELPRAAVPCCPLLSLEGDPSSLLWVSDKEEVPEEETKLISWEGGRSSPISSLCCIGAIFNSTTRQLQGPGWPAATPTPVASSQAWGQRMQSVR